MLRNTGIKYNWENSQNKYTTEGRSFSSRYDVQNKKYIIFVLIYNNSSKTYLPAEMEKHTNTMEK